MVLGEIWPVLKGLLDTIFSGMSAFSGEARGGIGGFTFIFVGESRGGRHGGGSSSVGEADLTVLTEAVEERESELEVTLSFEGLIGDLFSPKSSLEELNFPLIFDATDLTWIF